MRLHLRFDDRIDDLAQRAARVGGDGLVHRHQQRLRTQVQADARQVLLAREVLVEAAQARAGHGDDLADRDAGIAALDQKPNKGFLQRQRRVARA
jgi:hypothetical protein